MTKEKKRRQRESIFDAASGRTRTQTQTSQTPLAKSTSREVWSQLGRVFSKQENGDGDGGQARPSSWFRFVQERQTVTIRGTRTTRSTQDQTFWSSSVREGAHEIAHVEPIPATNALPSNSPQIPLAAVLLNQPISGDEEERTWRWAQAARRPLQAWAAERDEQGDIPSLNEFQQAVDEAFRGQLDLLSPRVPAPVAQSHTMARPALSIDIPSRPVTPPPTYSQYHNDEVAYTHNYQDPTNAAEGIPYEARLPTYEEQELEDLPPPESHMVEATLAPAPSADSEAQTWTSDLYRDLQYYLF